MQNKPHRLRSERWLLRAATSSLLALLLLASSAQAELRAELNESVRRAKKVSRELSVHVVELGTGEEIYSYNADQPRVIASNTKLQIGRAHV